METPTSGPAAPLQPTEREPQLLAPEQSPTGHPVASAHHYGPDLALLHYLLQDLRVVARRLDRGEIELDPYAELNWQVHGLARRTVVCNPAQLATPGDVFMVGFLGNRRSAEQAAEVDIAELDVIAEFRSYPGIISYSSIELLDNQWANLVLHEQPSDRQAWRHSQVHIAAAERLSPIVYHGVRIHNGQILGGAIGSSTVSINSTKYWDYDHEPLWHGFRVLREPTSLQAAEHPH